MAGLHWTTEEYHAYLQRQGQPVVAPRREQGMAEQEAQGMVLFPSGAVMGTWLPLKLDSNKHLRHEHWTRQHKRTKFQRQYVYDKLMSLWEDGPLLGLPLTIHLIRIAPRKLDDDNLLYALSAVRDGVSDWLAGRYLGGQDQYTDLRWEYAQQRIAPKFYAVEIRIERPKR